MKEKQRRVSPCTKPHKTAIRSSPTAAAGPAVNLVLAAGGIAWLLGHPASYRLCYFIAANLLLGAFNLLPIHGLDGWQINSNLGILFHFKIQTQKHSCVN
mgnify:CR=1 FL=1